MTTVGYGDKVPVTFVGRLLGVVWMFAALLLTTLLTAQLAASLTAQVTSLADPAHVRVAYVQNAASLEPLIELGVRPHGSLDVASGLAAVSANEIGAFVHDRPILLLLQEAPLRETVNRVSLAVLNEPV